MLAGFLVGMKIALFVISAVFAASEVAFLKFLGSLALLDVAWIVGWLPDRQWA